jgi:pantoate--beta-alanine ligase
MAPTIVAHEVDHARRCVRQAQRQGRRVGVVLTMGALHDGHLSLVRAARQECDVVVATIFVNPTQFAPGEDFDRYPRCWDADLQLLSEQGTELVFAPAVETMFPSRCTTWVEPPAVAHVLEGAHRPGHFRGVATVVLKLFQILPADSAYFGEKDFQQCLVIRDLVRDLNVPIDLRFCATVREPDGLAMSSRNRYLTPDQRPCALGLWQALQHASQQVAAGATDPRALEHSARATLRQTGVDRIDYVAVRDADTLQVLPTLASNAVMLIAAHVGHTRLIDNCRLSRQGPAKNNLQQ